MEENVVEELRKRNPYPDDIFIKPSKEEIKEIHKKVKIEGLIGSECGRVWNLCCDSYENYCIDYPMKIECFTKVIDRAHTSINKSYKGEEDGKEFEEQVKKAGFELSKLKELFIIEEMKPFFEDDSLKQSLRVRLKESKDVVDEYKEKVIKAIDKCKVYPQPCPTCPFYNSGEKECQLKKELKL